MPNKIHLILTSMLVVLPAAASALDAAEMTVLHAQLSRLEDLSGDPMLPATAEEAGEAEAPTGRPHLVIARSVIALLTEIDSTAVIVRREVVPPLSLARNLANLGHRDWALAWYERARLADADGLYQDEILGETAELLAACGDSVQIAEAIADRLEGDDALDSPDVLSLLLAALCRWPVGNKTLSLVDRIEAAPGEPGVALRLELASTRERGAQYEAALSQYRRLLNVGRALNPEQATRVIRGVGDTLFRLQRHREAHQVYSAIRQHDTGLLSAWATFQLGVLAVLSGRHDEAVGHFKSLCERDTNTPWRESACWRLAAGEELLEIDDALRTAGRSVPVR